MYLKYIGFIPPSIRSINPKYSSIHSVTNLKMCFDTTRNYQVRNYLFLTDEYRDNTEINEIVIFQFNALNAYFWMSLVL